MVGNRASVTTTLTVPPTTIMAGDSVAFSWSYADYPASDGWTLTYALAGRSTLAVTSTPNLDAHDIALTSAQTSALLAGAYTWKLRVSNGTTTTTVGTGRCDVQADVATAQTGDFAAWAETTLAMLEASIQGDMTDAVQQYTIGDRQITKIPMADRLKLRNQLRAEVQMAKSRGGFGAPVYMTPRAVS